jgi:hypothetical protein
VLPLGSASGCPAPKLIAAQVVVVERDQIEGAEEDAPIVLAAPDAIEARDAILVAGDRLAVNDVGA